MLVTGLFAAGFRLCGGDDCKGWGDRYEHENEDHHQTEHDFSRFLQIQLKQDKDGASAGKWPSPVGTR